MYLVVGRRGKQILFLMHKHLYGIHILYLGAGGHSLGRLSRESLWQVPDDALELHDKHRRFRVVRVVVHLAANLILVFTYHDIGMEIPVNRSFVSNIGTTASNFM